MASSFDYHSHHRRCGHAIGALRDYIESAIGRGFAQFGVSDHAPAFFLEDDHPLPGTMMAQSELPAYVAEARALQSEYDGRIDVRVGIEADFVEGSEDAYRAALDAHPLDYALGSVHWVRGINIFDRTRWAREDAAEVYAEYYRIVAASARSGLFDIIAHPTAVESYGPPIDPDLADALYPPVVDAIRASGRIVEVNTSGFRKMGGDDPFPNRRMLALLVRAGVPLTFGSDCHHPDEVGFGRDRVLALLSDLGVDVGRSRLVTVGRGPIRVFGS